MENVNSVVLLLISLLGLKKNFFIVLLCGVMMLCFIFIVFIISIGLFFLINIFFLIKCVIMVLFIGVLKLVLLLLLLLLLRDVEIRLNLVWVFLLKSVNMLLLFEKVNVDLYLLIVVCKVLFISLFFML